jgi:DNA-binding NarL/FixJ family response regulator
MTRVLIADGQLSIRQRLRQMLERNRDVQVVGEASDA